jgi:hypothetical protein
MHASEAKGRGFESHRARSITNGDVPISFHQGRSGASYSMTMDSSSGDVYVENQTNLVIVSPSFSVAASLNLLCDAVVFNSASTMFIALALT